VTRQRIEVDLPEWLDDVVAESTVLRSPEERMAAAVGLARRNVVERTGGPFGAIVVERDSGRLVAAGVNVVLASGNCTAHAEMVAIELAERRLGGFDLGADGAALELVSSVDPCAMCLGAVVWSGVASLLCGASSSAAAAVGFDEGPRPDDWVAQLECRGIEVVRGVAAHDAESVLVAYAERGGPIYNPSR
jgi:tRNA(Arg) A34 adenosine deaminase TadA